MLEVVGGVFRELRSAPLGNGPIFQIHLVTLIPMIIIMRKDARSKPLILRLDMAGSNIGYLLQFLFELTVVVGLVLQSFLDILEHIVLLVYIAVFEDRLVLDC